MFGDIFWDENFSGGRCFWWAHFGRDFVKVFMWRRMDFSGLRLGLSLLCYVPDGPFLGPV